MKECFTKLNDCKPINAVISVRNQKPEDVRIADIVYTVSSDDFR